MANTIFKRSQKIFFIKIIALLSIVRWYNILITAVAQYVTAIYVFSPDQSTWEILMNWDLHLIVLATSLIIAAGYIINSFYDLEKDLINRPEQTIFGRLVSKSFCLYCYLLWSHLILENLDIWSLFRFLKNQVERKVSMFESYIQARRAVTKRYSF